MLVQPAAAQSEEQKRNIWKRQEIKQSTEPDVKDAVLFLTSAVAAFITGLGMVVDGGQPRSG